MDPDRIAKFYTILRAYRGKVWKRTCENEVYRENKVYSLWVELAEKFDSIWQTLASIFYSIFCPVRSLKVSYDRIVAKVAFCPPRDTYVFNFDVHRSTENNKAGLIHGELLLAQFATSIRKSVVQSYKTKIQDKVLKHVECFYAFNKYGNRIACVLIHGPASGEDNQKVIVYSHTNAEDIGTSFQHMWRLRKNLSLSIFMYDYSGYGMSSGSASERNLYADVEAAVQELLKRTSFKMKNIILFGESMGSVPTVHMASRYEVYGVVLQCAFMSGLRIYFKYDGPTLSWDPFQNIERVPLIKSKTLIIHGTEDMLVDISHAVSMHRALKNAATPFWANGCSHMNIHKHIDYYDQLRYFIQVVLKESNK